MTPLVPFAERRIIKMKNYIYGGSSNIGYKRTTNEDFINAVELDNQTLFALVADGAGALPQEQ